MEKQYLGKTDNTIVYVNELVRNKKNNNLKTFCNKNVVRCEQDVCNERILFFINKCIIQRMYF